jgi:hypothetical protein
MDLREIGWRAVEWIHLAQNRPVAGCCECGDEPSDSGATELVTQSWWKISSFFLRRELQREFRLNEGNAV